MEIPLSSTRTVQLESFLDSVLKKSLQEGMEKRASYIQLAAQCNQLQQLCEEMKALSCSSLQTPAEKDQRKTESSTIGGVNRSTCIPRQKNKILVDLGNHFYTPAAIQDALHISLNIGCGVVLEMTTEDAITHLRKREAYAKECIDRQNVQLLRTKYRIRLVTEAIRRLHERSIGIPE